MVKNSNSKLLLLLIFAVFIFLRLWHLPQISIFSWDQERDARVVEKIITRFDLPLIGPRVVGDNGFYLGPYFFYLLTPFYWLSHLHPIATLYFLIFISASFFIFTFLTLKKIFNFKVAAIFLLIWGLLPATISHDQIAWNPILIPLSFSFLLLFLHYFRDDYRYYLLLGFFLGLTFHFHFQALFYSLFSLGYLFYQKPKSFLKFLWLIPGFLLTFLPLLIFDLRHQWLNLQLFFNFFFGPTVTARSLFSFLPVWTNYIAQITGFNNSIFAIVFYFFLLAYGYSQRQRPFFIPLTLLIFLSPFAFMLYGHRPSEYYFNYLLPIIILYFSVIFSSINLNKYAFLLIFFLLSFLSFKHIRQNPTSLFYKDQIVKNTKNILGDKDIYLTFSTPPGENNGFDYLIDYYHINRSQNPSRPNVRFIIPPDPSLPTFGNISLFIPAQI